MYKTSKEQQLTFDGFNQSCGMKLNPKDEYVLLADMSAPTNAATLGWSTSIPWTRPTVCRRVICWKSRTRRHDGPGHRHPQATRGRRAARKPHLPADRSFYGQTLSRR